MPYSAHEGRRSVNYPCDAPVADGRARLQSRQLRSLTPFFPEVVDALTTWFRDVVLDVI